MSAHLVKVRLGLGLGVGVGVGVGVVIGSDERPPVSAADVVAVRGVEDVRREE